MPTLYVIYGSDTPNEGRVKINWNFANLLAGSITGITASVFTNPNPTTKTVGGIPAGTTFVGDYYIQDLFDMLLYPSITPIFTSFGISAQSTSLEVGESVSGTKTFTWSINSTTYLKPNSIDIEDTTNTTTLASSLSNDGTENIAVSVTKTSPSSNIWTIYGEDTDDNVFSRQFRVDWYYRIFHGSNASGAINATQIAALSSTLATNDINGTYSIGAANYGYICVPSSFDIPTAFRNSSTNIPIEMAGQDEGYSSYDGLFHYSAVTLTRNSVNIAYRLYRTKNTISSSTSVIIKNSGATTAHLYDQYYTGSTTLGSFLSNFTPGGGGTITGVIPGTNIQTAGTPTNITISTVSNPSFNSLSASTYFCGTTSFDTIFAGFAPQDLDSVLTIGNSATTKDMFIRNMAGGSDHTISDWNLFAHSNIIGGEFIDFSTSTGEYSMTYLAPSFGFIAGNNSQSLVQSSQISISSVSNSLFLGGISNSAITTESSGILGGLSNQLLSTSGAFLIAGFNNTINGATSLDPNFYEHALILGGKSNTITNGTSTLIAASSSSSILSNINEGFVNSSIIASDSSSIEYSVISSIFDSFNTIIELSEYCSIIGSINSSISGRTTTSIIAGNAITATENYSLYTSNLRAETAIFSAGTNLNNIFVHKVTAGTNIITGGTQSNPTISTSLNPVFTSVSAQTYSADTIYLSGTNLTDLLVAGSSTRVIPGTNIQTGGTQSEVVVSTIMDPVFSSITSTAVTAQSVFATNISASTSIFSAGTDLNIYFNGLAYPEQNNVIYVSKTGNNIDGKTPQKAFTSISGATNYYLSNYNDASSSNTYTIKVIDNEDYLIYGEGIIIPNYVHLDARYSNIRGRLVINDGCSVWIREHSRNSLDLSAPPVPNQLVFKSGVSTTSYYKANVCDARGVTYGIVSSASTSSGQMFIDVKKFYAGTAYGLGSNGSYGNGHFHINIEDLYLPTNNTTGIFAGYAGTGTTRTIVGYIHHILNTDGATNTTAFYLYNGKISIVSTEIRAGKIAYIGNTPNELNLVCPLIDVSETFKTDLGQEYLLNPIFFTRNIISSTSQSYFKSGITTNSLTADTTIHLLNPSSYTGDTFLVIDNDNNNRVSTRQVSVLTTATTYVQSISGGTNIITGGTTQNPVISTSNNPLFNSVSANTFVSGVTDLTQIIQNLSIQDGDTITSGLYFASGSLGVYDTNGDHYFTFDLIENLSSQRKISLKLNDANRAINLSGNLTLTNNAIISGTNTGDQDLSSYLHSSGGTISGNTQFQTLSAQTYFSGSTPLETIINQVASSYSGSSSQLAVSSGNTSPYTLQLSDAFNLKVMSSSTFMDIIIPTNTSVAIPIGSQIMFKQGGAGQLRFSASTGVTLHSYGNAYNHVGQFSTSFLTKESNNLWVIDGNLTTLNL